jgi:hypothetical protein
LEVGDGRHPYLLIVVMSLKFEEHYHRERNHQGLDNKRIDPEALVEGSRGEVEYRERLGGLLKYYYRPAA